MKLRRLHEMRSEIVASRSDYEELDPEHFDTDLSGIPSWARKYLKASEGAPEKVRKQAIAALRKRLDQARAGSIHEVVGHWAPWPGHGQGAPERHSPLLDPSDRDESPIVTGKPKKKKRKKLNEAWEPDEPKDYDPDEPYGYDSDEMDEHGRYINPRDDEDRRLSDFRARHTVQDQVQILMNMGGVTNIADSIGYADGKALEKLVTGIIVSEPYHDLVKYLRS